MFVETAGADVGFHLLGFHHGGTGRTPRDVEGVGAGFTLLGPGSWAHASLSGWRGHGVQGVMVSAGFERPVAGHFMLGGAIELTSVFAEKGDDRQQAIAPVVTFGFRPGADARHRGSAFVVRASLGVARQHTRLTSDCRDEPFYGPEVQTRIYAAEGIAGSLAVERKVTPRLGIELSGFATFGFEEAVAFPCSDSTAGTETLTWGVGLGPRVALPRGFYVTPSAWAGRVDYWFLIRGPGPVAGGRLVGGYERLVSNGTRLGVALEVTAGRQLIGGDELLYGAALTGTIATR